MNSQSLVYSQVFNNSSDCESNQEKTTARCCLVFYSNNHELGQGIFKGISASWENYRKSYKMYQNFVTIPVDKFVEMYATHFTVSVIKSHCLL